VLDQVDNVAIAPWGDLILCEDGRDGNFVRGVTPSGVLYPIARNASEFAGSVFSPDRTTLFVNIQRPGLTLAITGPWE
jgi:secreted PhoX family phosphatase